MISYRYYGIGGFFLFFSLSLSATFKLGVENIPNDMIAWLRTCKVGLLVNHTSKNQRGQRTIDILFGHGIPITFLFAPEHGIDGTIAAGKDVHNSIDAKYTIPIISLHSHGAKKQITAEHVQQVDVVIVDIQDCGMRHFTYISTLLHILECVSQCKKIIVVLDRPNPLGYCMEGPVGNLLPYALGAYTAQLTLPLRHGLTMGELACYFNKKLDSPADVRVVPMQNYQRTMPLPATISYAVSPNIQSKQSCHGYSFLGLLGEVRPFDVAINTPEAFQCILLPHDIPCEEKTWMAARSILEKVGIQARPYSYHSTRKKKKCNGLRVSMTDINNVRAFQAFVTLIQLFKQAGVPIAFSAGFDHAAGTKNLQEFLHNTVDKKTFVSHVYSELHHFFDRVKPYLLYMPYPKIIELN